MTTDIRKFMDSQIDAALADARRIEGFTDEQIRTAIEYANLETAIELWREKDWETYQATRKALLAALRSDYSDRVGIPQMQFIFFINSHLAPRFPVRMPSWRLFTKDLPDGHSIENRSWAVASSGDFLRAEI